MHLNSRLGLELLPPTTKVQLAARYFLMSSSLLSFHFLAFPNRCLHSDQRSFIPTLSSFKLPNVLHASTSWQLFITQHLLLV